MLICTGFAAASADSPMVPITFNRRDVGVDDVRIDIAYCGVCHSDLHFVRNDWHFTIYPAVPGHEITGYVSEVGANAGHFKIGERVGVGCMVDSCMNCNACEEGLEQYCEIGNTGTYGATEQVIGGPTFGGYSNAIVLDKNFVLRIPEGMELAATAPLLCAGITMYSPLRHWGAAAGKKVGIIGLGGLGHMGLKLSHAMGATTILFTTSASKIEDGKRLGADEVVLSNNAEQMRAHVASFDFIINTASAVNKLSPYFALLKRDGTLVQVGAPEHPLPVPASRLLVKRLSLAGSAIGGIAETQEMLDFCAAKNIASDVEIIPIHKINEAYQRMQKGDVKYRFSIDMSSLQT